MYSSELYVSHGTYIIGYVIWNYRRVCTVFSLAITTPYSTVQTMFPVCAYLCPTVCLTITSNYWLLFYFIDMVI